MIEGKTLVYILYNAKDNIELSEAHNYVDRLKERLQEFGVRYWPRKNEDNRQYVEWFVRETNAELEDQEFGLNHSDFIIILHSSNLFNLSATGEAKGNKADQLQLIKNRPNIPILLCRMDDTPIEQYAKPYENLNIMAILDCRRRDEKNGIFEMVDEWVALMLLHSSDFGREKINEIKQYYCDMEKGTQTVSEAEEEKPYIFISYKHKKNETEDGIRMLEAPAMKYIRALNMKDCRLWYDRGISSGSDWLETLNEKLDHSKVVVAFITNEYLQSFHCVDEFLRAYHKGIYIVPVVLETLDTGTENIVLHTIEKLRKQILYSEQQNVITTLLKKEEIKACIRSKEESLLRDQQRAEGD